MAECEAKKWLFFFHEIDKKMPNLQEIEQILPKSHIIIENAKKMFLEPNIFYVKKYYVAVND